MFLFIHAFVCLFTVYLRVFFSNRCHPFIFCKWHCILNIYMAIFLNIYGSTTIITFFQYWILFYKHISSNAMPYNCSEIMRAKVIFFFHCVSLDLRYKLNHILNYIELLCSNNLIYIQKIKRNLFWKDCYHFVLKSST